MSIIRVKFVRGEEVKYISHLDLMKLFERALRRSKLPIAYSQGFNPHPQMVFGLPLSVGITSQAEYADFELSEEMDPEEFKNSLSLSLPEGIRIIASKEKVRKDNIMASISGASYKILLSSDTRLEIRGIQEKMNKLLSRPDIIVNKETKKGIKEIDIKPMIYKIEVSNLEDESNDADTDINARKWLVDYVEGLSKSIPKPSYNTDNIFCVSALLSAGSAANLKPELLIGAINETLGEPMKVVKIHRTGLYVGDRGDFRDPLDTEVLLGK